MLLGRLQSACVGVARLGKGGNEILLLRSGWLWSASARGMSKLASLKSQNAPQIASLAEEIESKRFEKLLLDNSNASAASVDHADGDASDTDNSLRQAGLSKDQVMLVATSAMAAMCVHHQSRICSLLGEGFYTIGPGGEELIGAAALALRPTDAMALHYRHVSMQMLRQLSNGTPLSTMLLNRARGHVVSSLDPVSGGNHCAIGGGAYDFVVTSTLASQAPPAVGRAIGVGLAQAMGLKMGEGGKAEDGWVNFPKDAVSFVTVGDGSVNNAHFLAAINVAEYWSHRHVRCPVVFGISDNGLCISLRGHKWLETFQKKLQMRVFVADSTDPALQYVATRDAVEYARAKGKPACVIYKGITRRFGHAATDRQNKYMSKEEIAERAATNPLIPFCQNVVDGGYATWTELSDLYARVQQATIDAFDTATQEPKISSREEIVTSNAAPLVEYVPPSHPSAADKLAQDQKKKSGDVMRMAMTRVYGELLECYKNAVYVGEDVEHGGYYLVSENLKDNFARRVFDWPPDETTLIGAGMGFSQVGLVPVVEIPYAKYLDCGADMFFEAAITSWLSKGQGRNGMIIRLQGFDRGIFGGNFHTHNTLHIPTGVDVVCYSNGWDYARGIRYAFQQARAGRIVMSVDSTNLLNLRHVIGQDNAWLRPYPTDVSQVMPFDEVTIHKGGNLGIVTYGNGVIAALQARQRLYESFPELADKITIIDSPLLSDTSKGLINAVSQLDAVIFADVCKEREMPLMAHIHTLQKLQRLPQRWTSVGACRTYNPLGSVETFLSADDIIAAARLVFF